jgi:YD repeat-containing protein
MYDKRGKTMFMYDNLNRLTSETPPGWGGQTSHSYDLASNRTMLTDPSWVSTNYSYDALNRMTIVARGMPARNTYYQYDEASNLVRKVLANGCFTYFEYDAANRATKILNCYSNGSPLVYFEYDYDAAGRITTVRRESGNVIYYAYDAADRLTGERWYDSSMAAIYAFQWDYDAVGNRTYESRGGALTYYSYNAANELTHLVSGGSLTYFDYDARGNCTLIDAPGGATYFQYNDADLVSSIVYPGGTANYFYYDGKLRRYAIRDSGGLAYFTWDRNGMNLLVEKDAYGNTIAEYTHGYTPVDGIGSIVERKLTVPGQWPPVTYYRYDQGDGRGTPFRIVDQNGNLVGIFEYDATGVRLQAQEVGPASRFGYQANWLTLKDSNGTLCLSPTRLYHAPTGRFLQRDPLPKWMTLGCTTLAPQRTWTAPSRIGETRTDALQWPLSLLRLSTTNGNSAFFISADPDFVNLFVWHGPVTSRVDPTGMGVVNCGKAIGALMKAMFELGKDLANNRTIVEARGKVDPGHARELLQRATTVEEALQRVMTHCFDDFMKRCKKIGEDVQQKAEDMMKEARELANQFSDAVDAEDWSRAFETGAKLTAIAALLIVLILIPGPTPI